MHAQNMQFQMRLAHARSASSVRQARPCQPARASVCVAKRSRLTWSDQAETQSCHTALRGVNDRVSMPAHVAVAQCSRAACTRIEASSSTTFPCAEHEIWLISAMHRLLSFSRSSVRSSLRNMGSLAPPCYTTGTRSCFPVKRRLPSNKTHNNAPPGPYLHQN